MDAAELAALLGSGAASERRRAYSALGECADAQLAAACVVGPLIEQVFSRAAAAARNGL